MGLSYGSFYNNSKNEIYSILCDIEISSITIYIQKKNCGLKSYKLPYGESLYKSNNEKVQQQLFLRLKDAITKLTKNENHILQEKIYITGSGLDELKLDNNFSSKNNFEIYHSKKHLNSKIIYNIEPEDRCLNKSIIDSFCILIEDLVK